MFELHPQLAQDCIAVGDLPLSRLLLMNDSQFPWLILVPRRREVTELFELSAADQAQLQAEMSGLGQLLKDTFNADKMNIAALGNMVSQLHIHVVVRFRVDPVWPAPIWGKLPPVRYEGEALEQRLAELRAVLGKHFNFVEADK
ncbi:HIT domain-containing protein [Halopseudomonas nanhaiensis]|uniref:HIT domain-containing protein n=1 Tax=Halopseudomonas nanhaiensis TaxID=2830842 RepID=UPI001CBC162A|nr:HIT domain-containing protein [Halopseudomonas nanhaiensis]UAW97528.1 HIT domain-containing protein [Halopseudomonas nanhaiensis]